MKKILEQTMRQSLDQVQKLRESEHRYFMEEMKRKEVKGYTSCSRKNLTFFFSN